MQIGRYIERDKHKKQKRREVSLLFLLLLEMRRETKDESRFAEVCTTLNSTHHRFLDSARSSTDDGACSLGRGRDLFACRYSCDLEVCAHRSDLKREAQ